MYFLSKHLLSFFSRFATLFQIQMKQEKICLNIKREAQKELTTDRRKPFKQCEAKQGYHSSSLCNVALKLQYIIL